MTLTEKSIIIKSISTDLGFDACGIARVKELTESAKYLQSWLEKGYQAEMHWMENHFEKRVDPSMLVDGAKSIIVLLKNYFPESNPFEDKKLKISRYALGEDYHHVIKSKLKTLLSQINSELEPVNGRYFVDSAPVLERAWAAEAGLGWIGKNSLLLNRKLGSYFFICEIIVDIELEYDKPLNQLCGTCTACIDACPTGAIVKPLVVDSNKCISYHTIENKGIIPQDISSMLNGRLFGCDICQEVCPWNFRAKPHKEEAFKANAQFEKLSDNTWGNLTEDEFNQLFQNSAVKRAGYKGLMRNIKAATA